MSGRPWDHLPSDDASSDLKDASGRLLKDVDDVLEKENDWLKRTSHKVELWGFANEKIVRDFNKFKKDLNELNNLLLNSMADMNDTMDSLSLDIHNLTDRVKLVEMEISKTRVSKG
ncbi:hypothetical protein GUITHDRAFT_122396 [Guillardia theta CCMP2712]|uniref:Uncharacterized protein n=1 Tax=Guillardia theta (strain CCMP2712) TaxID=905079 RepID=L1I5Q5_GUITC|nr:hypothetical protein GUITHDRAFT_122396 [Guillardia theta CCMP2712]EKX31407.1 hypothetical protein GUITHDRAFT_122396 [Guillardia theta CCMP2712]|eukprot:XP_005818387.1 hypothetical protein GUITHDRAFT_122396 [Guillardia theta CCMP2712]